MPSPDDLLTVTQIAKEVGCSRQTVCSWIDTGLIESECLKLVNVGKRGQVYARFVRWSEVMKIDYIPGNTHAGGYKALCPEGHLTIMEASQKLGVADTHVRRLVRKGILRGVMLPAPGAVRKGKKRRLLYFLEAKAVEDMLAEKKEAKCVPRIPGRSDSTPPILSPIDSECLAARRELWEKRGHVWPQKLRKFQDLLAKRQKAG